MGCTKISMIITIIIEIIVIIIIINYYYYSISFASTLALNCNKRRQTRLMQQLRCAATHHKSSHRFLQHASNSQRTHALARTEERASHHTSRCSSTCTVFTRPRITRPIIHLNQRPIVLHITLTPAGAVTSRRHAIAIQPHMTRTVSHGENSASMWPRGGGDSSRSRFMPCDGHAQYHAAACISLSRRIICARRRAGV